MPLRPLTLAVALALSAGLVACQPKTANETTAPAATQVPADAPAEQQNIPVDIVFKQGREVLGL